MKSFLLIMPFFLVMNSCDLSEFGNGIKEDYQTSFIERKDFFQRIEFTGKIISKKEYKKSDKARFRILIEIQEIESSIPIQVTQNPPYYLFDSSNPKTLELTVTKDIYESSSKNMKVIKYSNNDSLIVGNYKDVLLSSDKFNWNP